MRYEIFAIRTDWFFSMELIFAIFSKYPVHSIDNIFVFVTSATEIHIFKRHSIWYAYPITSNSLYTVLKRDDFLEKYFCAANLS